MPTFALAVAALVAGSPELGSSLAEFSRGVGLRQTLERVEVGRLGGPGQAQYWFRRTMRDQAVETVSWADTRSCPAARAVLAGMQDISMHATPLGSTAEGAIVLHGVAYMLRAPASSGGQRGEITVRSNIDSPLSRWAGASFSSLRPCWTANAPDPTGR